MHGRSDMSRLYTVWRLEWLYHERVLFCCACFTSNLVIPKLLLLTLGPVLSRPRWWRAGSHSLWPAFALFFAVLFCTGQGIDRLTQSALLFWKKKNGDGKLKEEGKKSVFHRGTLEETFRSQGCDAPRGVSQDLTGEVSAGVARGFRDQPCGQVKKEENGAQAQLSTTEVPGVGKRPHLIRDMITWVHKPTAPQSWGSP